MSRKSKIKAKKSVTAPVTPEQEDAAFELLGKSDRYVVGTTSDVDAAMSIAEQVGRTIGVQEGLKMPRTAGEDRVLRQKGFVAQILQEVFIETQKALSKHGPMHSGHEGFAVIREELDELWDEIKADRARQKSARTEAIQVAAMAVRYALDIDPR